MEQWRMATISFNLWGELSPIKDLPKQSTSSQDDVNEKQQQKKKIEGETLTEKTQENRPSTPKRSIGQAEIESSYFKVNNKFHIQYAFHLRGKITKFPFSLI
jgi:anoctamin-8